MITVVGAGPGNRDFIPPAAVNKILAAETLVGSDRSLNLFPESEAEKIRLNGDMRTAIDEMKRSSGDVVVMVSGDPGLFSLLALMKNNFAPQEIEVIPGISSAQALFARRRILWQDIEFVSLHGRRNGYESLLAAARKKDELTVLNGPGYPADEIAGRLIEAGYDGKAVIGERLSLSDERVVDVTLDELEKIKNIDNAVIYLKLKKRKKKSTGKLYGVGIGTGDPDLITMKAAAVIKAAEYVFVPRSSDKGESLALKIAGGLLSDDQTLIEITFPMTKDKDFLRRHWREAAAQIIDKLKKGNDVAFLTLGDPSLFSTFIYLSREIKEYKDKVEVEIIPGISSPFACAAAAGLEIAEGDQRVAIIPLPDDVSSIDDTVEIFDTIILLKIGRKLNDLIDYLAAKELVDKTVIVKSVGLSEEQVVRDLRSAGKKSDNLGYFSTAIIRKERA